VALTAAALAALGSAGCTASAPGLGVPGARPDGLVSIGAGLIGLAGLKATVYARGLPALATLAQDASGRLWATTAEYGDGGDDGVYLLERPGATPTRVLTGVKAPLGLAWQGDRLYVSSAAGIDAYSGLEGSVFATRETVLRWPLGVGESNNLIQSPDGRLLVGISAPCDHCSPTSSWSAAILSFRADGSDAHPYATGIRAAFGLAYYPGTSDLFVTMDQRDDLGARTPGDWLSLVRPGEQWGFPDCYGQGGAACDGVPAPTARLDTHGAVGGLAIVTGQLGAAVGASALVAEWALGKVQRVALTRAGSRYRASSGSVPGRPPTAARGAGHERRSPARRRLGDVIWAAGVEASPLARQLAEASGAETDRKGGSMCSTIARCLATRRSLR
jgi:hypothetical protein